MTHRQKLRGLLASILAFAFFISYGQEPRPPGIEGTWAGRSFPDSFYNSFRIRFEKSSTGYAATFSSDEQRALDIPLQKVTYDSARHIVTFSLVGDADSWEFHGKIDDTLFSGTITKGSQMATCVLAKQRHIPLPYSRQEVTFSNHDIKLSGSLYTPASTRKVPAIIFIHGSGAEPRFASAYFADYFARKGIAVLIYDKRGVGKSTGDWRTGTFEDLAKDAIAGIKLLEASPEIDAARIGVYGHSQGGSIVPMLLSMCPELAFGISSGSAGVSMRESDWYEVQNRFRKYVSGDNYRDAMKIMEKYLEFASTGNGYGELVDVSKKYATESWFRNYIGTIDSNAFFFRYYRNIACYNP
ncbi:MAG TPA: alpha/beta fold hydrolase, partial [Flavisolibacter sp.]